jgi:L-iditol 2-dehydrogenase
LKLKALVLTQYNQLEYIEVPKPKISDDEVLIKVKACAICGSDVHGYDGKSGRRIPPIIMGHEASGIIEEVGKSVKNYYIGERVTFDSTEYCGKCRYCVSGKMNLCDDRKVLGVSCHEYLRNGAMAEYITVSARILYRLPDDVTFEQAALVEPVSIALHAVRRSIIAINDTVVVFGAGTIGLLLIQLLKRMGCGMVIAVDIDNVKLEFALKNGATHIINSGESDLMAEIAGLTRNRGADAVFEAVGIQPTFKAALESVKKGGNVTLVGNLSNSVDFNLQSAVTRELTLHTTCACAGEYETSLDMIASGIVNVDDLIGAVAPLSEGDLWFKKLHSAEPGLFKVVLKPEEHSS